MQTHLHGKALKQRRPEKGIQNSTKKSWSLLERILANAANSSEGSTNLTNYASAACPIEISRTDREQTKQWYTNSGYLLSVQEYVSSNDIRLLDYLYCGADFSKEETQR